MVLQEYAERAATPRRMHILPDQPRRAVGVIRVSKVGKRDQKGEERFVSPREQRAKLSEWCQTQGITLVSVREELDVSGKRPLDKRPGLLPAIEDIERGAADMVVVAYFDRLVRSLRVQADILDRVEKAGGHVVALDAGRISNATAAQWLNATVLGMMADYHVRVTREKTDTAKRDAVERGVPPFPNIPPGYVRGSDGRLVVVEEHRELIPQVFKLRAEGASLTECRLFLSAHGITRSYRATQTMFANRLYLGEIHYAGMLNPKAHEPLVDRALFVRAGERVEKRGRPARSDRLLARLGVLVCRSCGARLTAATVWNHTKKGRGARKRYAIYRCGMPGDCSSPVTISATLVEQAVEDEVRRRLVIRTGTADRAQEVRDAAALVELTQKRLKNAIALLSGDDLDDLEAAQQQLAEHRTRAREATELYEQLRASMDAMEVLSATHDWDKLTMDEQRALIRRVLPSVAISPACEVGSRIHWPAS